MKRGFIPVVLIAVLALVIAVGGVGVGLAWKTDILDRWLPAGVAEFLGKWETCRSNSLGFEVGYPGDWEVLEEGGEVPWNCVIFSKDYPRFRCRLEVWTLQDQEEFESHQNQYLSDPDYKQSTLTIAGVSAIKLVHHEFPTIAQIYLKNEKGDAFFYIFHWRLAEESACADIFDRTLSTFKFLK